MKLLVSIFMTTLLLSGNVAAVEPVTEQQAFFYYTIPFGGVSKSENAHKFGFRIDRATVDALSGQYIDHYDNSVSFHDHMKKPASLNFQMGYEGISAFKMHGYDYLPHLVSYADEEAAGSEPEVVESKAVDTEVVDTEEVKEEKLPNISDVVFDQTNFGLILGIGIGIIALTGSGG